MNNNLKSKKRIINKITLKGSEFLQCLSIGLTPKSSLTHLGQTPNKDFEIVLIHSKIFALPKSITKGISYYD